mmetsp:Transcript_3848/g.13318  ORF Transcript_3848/g.13318 Transcript_3848/m.13318 type:complete len:211 (-) Transcript_3848:184-816(-)|eukprot:31090-Pelagococcus_subviridis.AAC.3
MIRRLVEEEEAAVDAAPRLAVPRGGQQQPRERDAHLPPPRERVARAIPRLSREPEAVEDVRDAAFDGVAADRFEAIARGDHHRRAVDVPRRDRLLRGSKRALRVDDVRHAAPRLLRDRARGAADRGLLQVADVRARRHEEVAAAHLARARDASEQRALPAAVRADEADALAGLDAEVRAREKVAVAHGDAHVAEDHDRSRGVAARDDVAR